MDANIVSVEEHIASLQNQAQQYDSQVNHLEHSLQELRTAIYETNTEQVETQSNRNQIDHDVDRLKQEQPILTSEMSILEQQISESVQLQVASQQSLVDLESVNQQRQGRIDTLEETIRQLESEDSIVVDQITDLKVEIGQTQQKRLALREKVAAAESQLQHARHNLQSLNTDIDNSQSTHQDSQRAILTAESRISELFQARQDCQQNRNQLRSQRDELADEKDELADLLRQQNHDREQFQEQLHSAQMHLNENRLRVENLIARAHEELSLDIAEHYQQIIDARERARLAKEAAQAAATASLAAAAGETEDDAGRITAQTNQQTTDHDQHTEQAVATGESTETHGQPAGATDSTKATDGDTEDSGQDADVDDAEQADELTAVIDFDEPIDLEAAAQEVEDLKQKIHRLGNVNLDAITEQDELEQRAEYLSVQLKDLTDSRSQLEQLIAKINKESEERFRSNFEAIQENFGDLFRKLFGGGRAEIVLEDPDDILECGIEIVARPPGKQLRSISLMSGGEKTMTAVALLLAIFKSKPSPFCLLDEVDAALDEANVERFNLVVKEFLSESQFVIITHSRRTMSIADVIYGITMQEQGVSKKVSVRFDSGEPEPENDTDSAVA